MPLIDDRGRVFGRINLIDLALLVFALLLVPLGYGAYLLFRTPPPRIVRVTPNPLPFSKGEQRVRITGEHLRPFLRAQIGRTDAKNFLIESPTAAEVVFNELPPGNYDIALFDPSEEIARLSDGVRIAPPPQPPVQFVGRVTGAAASLERGVSLGSGGKTLEILQITPGAGGEYAATLRGSCDGPASPCALGGTTMEKGKPVTLKGPGNDDVLTFTVDEIRADGVWVDVHTRLYAIAEVLELVKVGDVDRFREGGAPKGITSGATVLSLEEPQQTESSLVLNFSQGLADSPPYGASIGASGRLPLKMRPAVLRMPVQRIDRAWKYRDEIIRPGSAVAFETADYFVRGLILRVVRPDTAETERDRTDQ